MTNTVRSVRFTVEGDPVPWARPEGGKKGHRYTADNQRAYKQVVALRAREAMKGQPPMVGAAVFSALVFLPMPKKFSKKKRALALAGGIVPAVRPDGDNYAKIVMDACNDIVYRDDGQCVDIHVSKRYSENPRLEIEVTEWRGVTG